jgi:hypothetical protein
MTEPLTILIVFVLGGAVSASIWLLALRFKCRQEDRNRGDAR